MKKKIFFVSLIILNFYLFQEKKAFAQAPEKMSYQSVIRNGIGSLVTNQAVGLRISILQGSVSGTIIFSETQNGTTNGNGLVSIIIGNGTAITGSIGSINWGAGPYFIKTETDPTGGTNYTITGTTELLSVPYALFAANVPVANWNGSGNDISNSNSGNVGIGTTTPSEKLQINGNVLVTNPLDISGGIYSPAWNAFSENGYSFYTAGATPLSFGTNSTRNMTILSGGNVGIGTTSPAYLLDVTGTAGPRLRVFSQDGSYAGLISKNNTHEYFAGVQADYESAGGINSGYHIYDNTAGIQRMVIDADGNMGIGNPSPQAKLDVIGNFKITDGTEGAGKVLTSDASGLASWQPTSMKCALKANLYFSNPFVMQDGQSYLADFSSISYVDNLTYANGIITVPESGLYHFDLFACTAFGYTNTINLQILTNINGNLNDQHFSNSLSTDLKLNAGDQVSFTLIQYSGGPQTLFNFSKLSCHKVF